MLNLHTLSTDLLKASRVYAILKVIISCHPLDAYLLYVNILEKRGFGIGPKLLEV